MKTKNKKLFALLMLPAVIAMMVLPLCSFTTVQNTEYDVFRSLSNIQLGYTYNRKGNYSYDLYNGLIGDSQRVLVSKSATTSSQVRDSIEFYANDYFMGDSTKSIDIRSFTVSTLSSKVYPVTDQYLELGLCYQSDDLNYSWFNGDFIISDYHHSDDIWIELYNYSLQPFTNDNGGYALFDASVDLYLNVYNPNNNSFDNVTLSVTDNLYYLYGKTVPMRGSDTVVLDVSLLVFNVLDNAGYDSADIGKEYLISTVSIELIDFPEWGQTTFEPDAPYKIPKIGALRVNSLVYNITGFGTIYEPILEFIGEGRYKEGYNAGISSAPGVWGSLSTFLTKTVGSFLNTPLFPGFNVSVIVTVFVGALLLISFLKLFAGG